MYTVGVKPKLTALCTLDWLANTYVGAWHRSEPLPMYVSMFLVHRAPTLRDAPGGTWVSDPLAYAPYFKPDEGWRDEPEQALLTSGYSRHYEELNRRRNSLPLCGETAFADTAAAFAALPPAEQDALAQLQVRRRLNVADEGWLAPLVRRNPRSGLRSLHSPIWASRPRVRPPVEVEGMNAAEGRGLLDRLEAHVLQPQFRFDHAHVPGDVTIWDNYMTVHNSAPSKAGHLTNLRDSRLLYRISCKGQPAPTLPRNDQPLWLKEHIAFSYTTPLEILES